MWVRIVRGTVVRPVGASEARAVGPDVVVEVDMEQGRKLEAAGKAVEVKAPPVVPEGVRTASVTPGETATVATAKPDKHANKPAAPDNKAAGA